MRRSVITYGPYAGMTAEDLDRIGGPVMDGRVMMHKLWLVGVIFCGFCVGCVGIGMVESTWGSGALTAVLAAPLIVVSILCELHVFFCEPAAD